MKLANIVRKSLSADIAKGARRARRSRKGAVSVEFAVVGSMTLLLLIGFAVLSLGVYRYQQVAYLARVGARYASTHGAQYRADNQLAEGDSDTWEQDIQDNGILPQSSALDPSKLNVSATWSAGDNEANAATSASNFTLTADNAVTVTVTYQWVPEGYLANPITFTSSSTMPMAY